MSNIDCRRQKPATNEAMVLATGEGTGNWVSESNPVPVAQAQTYTSDNLTRPANTTAYSQFQEINSTGLSVSATSNANPDVVTTSANHGLTTGQFVSISGSTGDTAINGIWRVVVLSATTFSLQDPSNKFVAVAGNGAWVSGGTVIRLLAFQLGRNAGAVGTGTLTRARMTKFVASGTPTIPPVIRLYLYNATVTPGADQATFNFAGANEAKDVDYIDFVSIVEGSGGDCTKAFARNLGIDFYTDPNGYVYGRLSMHGGAYTPPDNSENFLFELMATVN